MIARTAPQLRRRGQGLWMALLGMLALATPALSQVSAVHSPHGPLAETLDCSDCHTAGAWRPLRDPLGFSHEQFTGFPLTGAHASARCSSCHEDLRFDGPDVRPGECGGCHLDVHQGRLDPNCTTCHNDRSFQDVAGLEIHARTSFPLDGAHQQVTCESCHTDDRGGAFSPLPTECVACHQEDYEEAQSVDHVTGGLSTDCVQCHTTVDFHHMVLFDHEAVAPNFPLLGAHARLACQSCHIPPGNDLIFSPSGVDDCVACHQADYLKEHGNDGFPTDCVGCHNVESWGDADFDHQVVAPGFDLQGAHRNAPCSGCHVAGTSQLRFQPVDNQDCVACHQADYTREHDGSGFPTDCLTCHTVDDWQGASFDHDAQFFPIYSGSHAAAWTECQDCHTVPGDLSQYSCTVCHTPSDTDPGHSNVQDYVYESTACLSCHPDGTH